MIDWNEIAKPPRKIPDLMRAASKLMHDKENAKSIRAFEKVFDQEDKYYFSSSEAHALDRRTK